MDQPGIDSLISPPSLMNAVAEDANPSVHDVALFQQQIKEKKIKALVFNNQTSGGLTSQLREMAEKAGIPVVGVSHAASKRCEEKTQLGRAVSGNTPASLFLHRLQPPAAPRQM
jgi:hypothetical protein